tara:strand:- start:692 stop:1636 length:945 start_codon:yes stop_codon:yes gene_type:complete
MKTVLLSAVWRIDSKYERYSPYIKASNYSLYKEANAISKSTYIKHNRNFIPVTLLPTESFPNPNLAFYYVFKETYKLWKLQTKVTNKHNILFHDADSLCLKNLNNEFSEIKNFMMFGIHNDSNRKTLFNNFKGNINSSDTPFFSCSLRYFPTSMSKGAWILGFWAWKKYFEVQLAQTINIYGERNSNNINNSGVYVWMTKNRFKTLEAEINSFIEELEDEIYSLCKFGYDLSKDDFCINDLSRIPWELWDVEQIIYNYMIRTEGTQNYSNLYNINQIQMNWNQPLDRGRHVRQFHGSRGIKRTLNEMKKIIGEI